MALQIKRSNNPEIAAQARRDVATKIIHAFAELKKQNLSAYKVEILLGIRRGTAKRILALAEKEGILRIVGRTRKGYPVYGWKEWWQD